MKSIHQFTVKDLSGEEVSLEKYKGKVLLVVNTASACGFTPQLKEMEALYQEYKDQGVEVLAFPSNDFGKQEPLEGAAIQEFCELRFKTSFPIFEKSHVKGAQQSELYQFLSSKKENGAVNSTPKWNFHKYLIDQQGRVIDYYYAITKPNSKKVKKAIEKLLGENE
jgi:glutathione peroxidase